MIIPVKELATDVLNALIEEFVLREGTEYGSEDVGLEDKIAQVKHQLTQGLVVIVYSELHQTVNILPTEQFKQEFSSEQE